MRHLEAIEGRISDRQEQIELCSTILNDLLEIQKIVAGGFYLIYRRAFKMLFAEILIHMFILVGKRPRKCITWSTE